MPAHRSPVPGRLTRLGTWVACAVRLARLRSKPHTRLRSGDKPSELTRLGSRAHSQMGMFPHLCPDASPQSAVELGISKTVLGSNP